VARAFLPSMWGSQSRRSWRISKPLKLNRQLRFWS